MHLKSAAGSRSAAFVDAAVAAGSDARKMTLRGTAPRTRAGSGAPRTSGTMALINGALKGIDAEPSM